MANILHDLTHTMLRKQERIKGQSGPLVSRSSHIRYLRTLRASAKSRYPMLPRAATPRPGVQATKGPVRSFIGVHRTQTIRTWTCTLSTKLALVQTSGVYGPGFWVFWRPMVSVLGSVIMVGSLYFMLGFSEVRMVSNNGGVLLDSASHGFMCS